MSRTFKIMGKSYVLEACHDPKTYGLGAVQRGIVAFLAMAPHGFDGALSADPETGRITIHGEPMGTKVSEIAQAVYATLVPSSAQIRVVQRNVRRLESLGLVDCWHGTDRYIERHYTTWSGRAAVMPQAVSVLWVALRWRCEHLERRDREEAEYQARRSAEYEARRAETEAWIKGDDPVAVLQSALGGSP